MRVMLLSDLYPPAIGGIELHVRNLARGLSERGHRVSVVTMHHEGQSSEEHDGDLVIHRLRGTIHRLDRAYGDTMRRFAPPFPDPELLPALWRIIRSERPEIVHGHNWLTRSFLPLKRVSRAALLLTLHDYALVCAKRTLVFRDGLCDGPALGKCLGCAGRHYGAAKGGAITLGNFMLGPLERRLVDLFLPVSSSVATACSLGTAGVPFDVVPNFVPDDVAELTGPEADTPDARLPAGPYILFVGALTGHKGVPVLLDAYRRLTDPPPLVLIGTRWPETPRSFPEGVTVLTDLPHREVIRAWHGSLFGVIPSTFPDPCPTVAMEAMATGRALVASDIGGLPDLIDHGSTGLLVRPADPAVLAGAMQQLIADPTAARRFGESGRHKVRDFMSSQVITRIEAAYLRALGNDRGEWRTPTTG